MNEKNAGKYVFEGEGIGFGAGILLTVAAIAAIVIEIIGRLVDNEQITHNLVFHIMVPSLLVLAVIFFWSYFLLDRKHKRLMQAKQARYIQSVETVRQHSVSVGDARDDYVSYISNDIKRYVAAARSGEEWIIHHKDDPESVTETATRLLHSTISMEFLIRNLTHVSALESQGFKPAKDLVDIQGAIEGVYPEIEQIIEGRKVRFSIGPIDLTHRTALGDTAAIRMILENVIVNALEFIKEDGNITLGVKELPSESGNAEYCFVISDNGVGMSATYLDHIFTLESCANGSLRKDCREIGLNMAVARKMIYELGGSLRAESVEEQGTHVYITIPLTMYQHLDENEQFLDGLRILVVEDNSLNMEITQFLLEEKGAIVTPAENGKVAVDTFRTSMPDSFDVILMDVMMPVKDGITATREIRALERRDAFTVPIVAMTANGRDEDIENVLKAGMSAHLMKPVKPEELFGVLLQCKNLITANRQS